MYYLALFVELVHRIVSPFYPFFPILNRAEVFKVSITHYFNPKKPQTELGYFPIVPPEEGIRRTVEYWKQKQFTSNNSSTKFFIVVIVAALVFIVNKYVF
jgi:hypothetical protein